MPRDTYDGNPLYGQMLRPEQVYYVEDYDAAGLAALMRFLLGYAGWLFREHRTTTLLIVDDCVDLILDGSLPLVPVFTKGRSNGLACWIVVQSLPRHGTVSPILRQNLRWVMGFQSVLPAMLDCVEWIPSHEKKAVEVLYRDKIKSHTAAVIVMKNGLRRVFTAPFPVPNVQQLGSLNLPTEPNPRFPLPLPKADQDDGSGSSDDGDDYGGGGSSGSRRQSARRR